MATEFAQSTIDRLQKRLEEERIRLIETIEGFEKDREEARLSESPAEHNSDPENVDGGSLAFELEKDLSLEQNAMRLLEQVRHAQRRMEEGEYGKCEMCGEHIPLARLEALPYATACVSCASAR